MKLTNEQRENVCKKLLDYLYSDSEEGYFDIRDKENGIITYKKWCPILYLVDFTKEKEILQDMWRDNGKYNNVISDIDGLEIKEEVFESQYIKLNINGTVFEIDIDDMELRIQCDTEEAEN